MENLISEKAVEEVQIINETLKLYDRDLLSPEQSLNIILKVLWAPESSIGLMVKLSEQALSQIKSPASVQTSLPTPTPPIPLEIKKRKKPEYNPQAIERFKLRAKMGVWFYNKGGVDRSKGFSIASSIIKDISKEDIHTLLNDPNQLENFLKGFIDSN